jgi:hypothetical protein
MQSLTGHDGLSGCFWANLAKVHNLRKDQQLRFLQMSNEISEDETRRIAEAVRAVCLRAALDGYERAGLAGLCLEGRWEVAMDAIRGLDMNTVLQVSLKCGENTTTS